MSDLTAKGVLLIYLRTSYNAANAVLHFVSQVHAKNCPIWKLYRCSNDSVLNKCCKESQKQTVNQINSNKLIHRQTLENLVNKKIHKCFKNGKIKNDGIKLFGNIRLV